MRLAIKRFFRRKEHTPEQIERAYRQMIAARETQKREARWQSIAVQTPKK